MAEWSSQREIEFIFYLNELFFYEINLFFFISIHNFIFIYFFMPDILHSRMNEFEFLLCECPSHGR
jgi:hypothetical protein